MKGRSAGGDTQSPGRRNAVAKRVILIAAMCAAVVGVVAGSAQAQSATPPSEKFVLTGLVYVEGGRGMAWLLEPTFTQNQAVAVSIGDTVGPYRLTKILEDQVELEGPGGKVSIPLAGTASAVSVATISREVPQAELPPHPALANPDAIVVPRGDPSRNFPVADLFVGAGAVTGEAPAPQPPVARAMERGIVPSWMQVPPPASPAPTVLQNPNAIVVPRGDPRRDFPAASLFIGAGAQVLGRP